jgi:hypothetical protein
MMLVKGLLMLAGLFLIIAIPQVIDDAINALPQPIPQLVGAGMFIAVAIVFIALLNRLMKGMNE